VVERRILRPTNPGGGPTARQIEPEFSESVAGRILDLLTGACGVRANWLDNPWFAAELEQERLDCLRIQPDQYDHIWEGNYVSASAGAYYARELAMAKTEGRIGRVAFDPLMTVRLFCDIGGTGAPADAFSFWPAQLVGREIRVRDYYQAVGQPLAAHLNWLRAKGHGPELATAPATTLCGDGGPQPGQGRGCVDRSRAAADAVNLV